MVVLGSEPKSLVLGAVDPEPKAIVIGPEIVVPRPKAVEVIVHYNYRYSGTQDVAKARTCWHQKPNDIPLGS